MDVPLDEKGKAAFTQVLIGTMKKAYIKKSVSFSVSKIISP